VLDSSKNDKRRKRATTQKIAAIAKDSISPGKAEVLCQKNTPIPVKAKTRIILIILEPPQAERWGVERLAEYTAAFGRPFE
jgi:hypothetical protein